MSPIVSAAAASPTINLFTHGHKKGAHSASGAQGAAAGSTQGPATTQSLLSSLFESIEQVIGVSVTASAHTAPAIPSVAGASPPAQASAHIYASLHSPNALGANVNANV